MIKPYFELEDSILKQFKVFSIFTITSPQYYYSGLRYSDPPPPPPPRPLLENDKSGLIRQVAPSEGYIKNNHTEFVL